MNSSLLQYSSSKRQLNSNVQRQQYFCQHGIVTKILIHRKFQKSPNQFLLRILFCPRNFFPRIGQQSNINVNIYKLYTVQDTKTFPMKKVTMIQPKRKKQEKHLAG